MTTNPHDSVDDTAEDDTAKDDPGGAPDPEVEEPEPLDDDERTVRRLLQGAQNPPGDIERAAAGLPDKHLDDDDPVWKREEQPE